MNNKSIKFLILVITLTLVLASSIPATASHVDLKDIKESDWYTGTVKELVEAGVISGYTDGTFKPDNSITRAEFAKIVRTSLKIDLVNGNAFDDTASHWGKSEINTLVKNKGIIVSDYKNGFGPDVNITRVEMAKMIVRSMGLEDEVKAKAGEKTKFIDDSKILKNDKPYIIIASDYEIINGYPDKTFKPSATATRAEAAQMIINMLETISEGKGKEPVVENEEVVKRVNERLENRNTKISLYNGIESVAKHENPKTYEELIENFDSLKQYEFTTSKKNDWELIALEQFISNPEDGVNSYYVGAIKMKTPNDLELSSSIFEGKSFDRIKSNTLKSNRFFQGLLIKNGEVLGWVNVSGDHYYTGLSSNDYIHKADYISFTKYTKDIFPDSIKFDHGLYTLLIVFDNPFKE